MAKRKCSFNESLKRDFPYLSKRENSNVFCIICSSLFSIASGGKNHITSHINTSKHKSALKAAASSSIKEYFPSKGLDDTAKKVAIAEGVLTFHNVKHNQNFRSMDCMSKLMKKVCDSTYSCARTKSEALVENVFAPWAMEELNFDLKKSAFVSLYCDSSNHGNIKIFPVLVRYFDDEKGVCVKLLELKSLGGENSDLVSKYLLRVINKNELKGKIVGFCADNTNMNFGGCARKGANNIFTKLKAELNVNIFGIGCAAHIANNALKMSSDCLPIDIEVILVKIYSYFYIYTLRVEELKDFCNYVSVQYQQVLGYCKTRWLALLPAISRLIEMFTPLKEYFLSQRMCPLLLKTFFNDASSQIWIHFIHIQANIFHNAVKSIEGQNTTILEVTAVLIDLLKKFQSRLQDKFVPTEINVLLEKFDFAKKKEILDYMFAFYSNCIDYLTKWMVTFKEFEYFYWMNLRKEVTWQNVSESLKYVLEQMSHIKIDESQLYDEFVYVKTFAVDKVERWNVENVDTDKRWIEIFSYFKNNSIPFENILKLVQLIYCLPGTNAPAERIFSVINQIWSSDKNQLKISTLKSILVLKTNFNFTCAEFYDKLMSNANKLEKIHSSLKYNKI